METIIKSVFYLVLLIIIFFFSFAQGSVSFNPFKISLPNWLEAILLLSGIVILSVFMAVRDHRIRKESFEKGIDYTVDYIVNEYGGKEIPKEGLKDI